MTFSGSFVSLQRTPPDYPNGAWDYPRLIKDSPVKPGLRVFMHVGEDDFDRGGMQNWVAGNNNLAAELAGRGYHYRFVTASNSGDCDGRAIRAILPDALPWLWRGYTPS